MTSIVGVQTCIEAPDACDLSAGIETSDASNTVVFNLVDPDPDFLYKLASPPAFPVPSGVPMDGFVEGAFPGTGPYVVTSVADNEVRLTRNPHFRVWDAEVRPDGLADEIVWTTGIDPSEQISMIERGESDWMPLRSDNQITAEQFADLRARYAGQLQFGSNSVVAGVVDVTKPPFDKLQARQALNMAIDRQATADLFGGPVAVSITCQVLPPGWFGYEPYCPYTTHPDPGGRWQAPDLSAARELVAASGTAGASVHVGPFRARHAPLGDHLVSVLIELGYEVSADSDTDDDHVFEMLSSGAIQVGAFEYRTGTLAPSELLGDFTHCLPPEVPCDVRLDELVAEARDLQTSDTAAAAHLWAQVDRHVVDSAVWVPLFNPGADYLSARVGNYQFHPSLNVLVDQLWVY